MAEICTLACEFQHHLQRYWQGGRETRLLVRCRSAQETAGEGQRKPEIAWIDVRGTAIDEVVPLLRRDVASDVGEEFLSAAANVAQVQRGELRLTDRVDGPVWKQACREPWRAPYQGTRVQEIVDWRSAEASRRTGLTSPDHVGIP